ncbi:ferritin-like domain-containing protein [uncultured Maricaulis sp.]|uniref:ferritin-like domain-containing protein n=1 Tax=uncultured Maricaulis sp. TaxID=174710 RepID=UPI0030D6EAA8
MAIAVLQTAEPRAKAAAARALYRSAQAGTPGWPHPWPTADLPAAPARPARPQLVAPGRTARRRLSSVEGRTALLHAIAHIEFNAIDLAIDMAVRFGGDPSLGEAERTAFLTDWIAVGDDEARHFVLIADRLEDLGTAYGDLPAHDGLWDAARATGHDLAARLAIAPLVLEARGLDVTPGMIDRLNSAGDTISAGILKVIYSDEIGHVATGMRWFQHVCSIAGDAPADRYHRLVQQYYRGSLKPPFNIEARDRAAFPSEYYLPLAATGAPLA